MKDTVNVKWVQLWDGKYLKKEDVARFIRRFAKTEDTDTRMRLEELAFRICLT